MAQLEETIVTGRKYRIWDEINAIWRRVSFWTKASDVEFEDGKNAEEKMVEVVNTMDDLNDTVTEEITVIDSNKVSKMTGVSGYQTVDVLGYNPTTKKLGLKVNGADTVIPFSSKANGILKITGTLGCGVGYGGLTWNYSTVTIKITIQEGVVTRQTISGNSVSSSAWSVSTNNHYGDASFSIDSVTWTPAE